MSGFDSMAYDSEACLRHTHPHACSEESGRDLYLATAPVSHTWVEPHLTLTLFLMTTTDASS